MGRKLKKRGKTKKNKITRRSWPGAIVTPARIRKKNVNTDVSARGEKCLHWAPCGIHAGQKHAPIKPPAEHFFTLLNGWKDKEAGEGGKSPIKG